MCNVACFSVLVAYGGGAIDGMNPRDSTSPSPTIPVWTQNMTRQLAKVTTMPPMHGPMLLVNGALPVRIPHIPSAGPSTEPTMKKPTAVPRDFSRFVSDIQREGIVDEKEAVPAQIYPQ